jgi:hypothetical protein
MILPKTSLDLGMYILHNYAELVFSFNGFLGLVA